VWRLRVWLGCHAGLLAAASKAAREAGVGGAPPPGAFGDTGVPPEVMNRQAQQIWSMLDDMASNDPTVCCGVVCAAVLVVGVACGSHC